MLLGWLDEDAAARLLHSRIVRGREPEFARRLEAARDAVASRPVARDPALLPAPAALLADAGVADVLTGQDVAIATLRALRALQPYVFVDRPHPGGRDEVSVARAMLGPGSPAPVTVDYDAPSSSFVVSSPSQNLAVLGEFAGPIPGAPPGAEGVGFLAGVAPSRARAALVQGCAVLVDGYHRAVALLAAGVEMAPLLVVSESVAEAWSPGMLAADVVLGPRPPTLADYLDDEVSIDVELPYEGRELLVSVRVRDRRPPSAEQDR